MQGLTLGHFPQSFEFSTVGGWVATRSAGQASTGYGRIDELVEGLRLCAPAGELVLGPVPATAAGPSLLELAVGSEGALGRDHRGHAARAPGAPGADLRGLVVRLVRGRLRGLQGARAARRLARHRAPVRRGGDPPVDGPGGRGAGRSGWAAPTCKARGREEGCLAIVGYEGSSGRRLPSARSAPARCCARAAACRWASGPGAPGSTRPVRRPLPARRADGPRHHGRDAGDGDLVERPGRPARRGGGRAARVAHRPRHAAAGDVPRLAPLPLGRVAVLHLPRPPGGGGRARAVERGQERGQRGDREGRRHHHPPPRGGARPPAVDARRGGRRGPRRCCGPPSASWTPRGS